VRRLSVATSLLIVVGFGLGLAALRNGDRAWASATYTVVLGCLGLAIVGAIVRVGLARTFCLGFTVFCGGTLALGFGGDRGEDGRRFGLGPRGPSPEAGEAPPLIFGEVLSALEEHVIARGGPPIGSTLQVKWGFAQYPYPATLLERKGGQFLVKYHDGTPEEWVKSDRIAGVSSAGYFLQVGYVLGGMVSGLVGGALCCLVHGGRPARPDADRSRAAAADPPRGVARESGAPGATIS
jgi:hypothetical protein